MPSDSPASTTNTPDADPPPRDLSGGADTSGFVGVDPIYQNYSTDSGKPYVTDEEKPIVEAAMAVGTRGATAIVDGGLPKLNEDAVMPQVNDEGQVQTEGGEAPNATIAPEVTTAAAADQPAAETKTTTKTPAKE
jgi:hypothetical protein